MFLFRGSRALAIGLYASAPLIVVSAVILTGCASEVRTRVMHFFFEYPEPSPETVDVAEQSGSPIDESSSPIAPAPRFASRHPPFVKRECRSCHIRQTGQTPRPDFMTACQECHKAFFAYHRFGHAPVVAQECRLCHVMHVSPSRGLLKQPQAVLCVRCHAAQQDPAALSTYHQNIGSARCTACHDPHFADNQLLLKPEEVRRRALGPAEQARAIDPLRRQQP